MLVSPGQGHLPPPADGRGRRRRCAPGSAIGERRQPARRAPRSRPRTAARSSSGSSRTATWSPPASRWSASTPKECQHDRDTISDRHRRRRTPRSSGLGAYRPRRVVPNSEIVDAIDSTDEWIQQRSGIKQRRWAGAGRDRADDVASRRRARRSSSAGHRRRRRSTASSSRPSRHLLQTPAVATAIADELGTDQAAALRHLRRLRGLLPRRRAGLRHGPRRQRHATCWSIGVERLTDITDPTDRGTAFIFADGAGAAVVGPSDEPGIGPVVWGSDGEQFDLIRQSEDWRDVVGTPSPAGVMPHLHDGGQPGVPLGVLRDGQDRAAGARPRRHHASTTSTSSCPHQANMRITDAMARAHEAARARRDRPRHRRAGQHLGGVDPARRWTG